MRKILMVTAVAAAVAAVPTFAVAQERMGDAVLGAASGALVGGPVGAVAGGVIGYTVGPHIARGMGFRHHHRHYRYVRTYHSRDHVVR